MYTNVGFIWAYIHADSQDIWKSFSESDKTKGVKNLVKNTIKKLLGHFQKSATGSESMCRSVMVSCFQKWS